MSKRGMVGPAGAALTALQGASSVVHGVQFGTLAIAGTGSGTATLSTRVDVNQSFVVPLGVTCDTGTANPVFTHARVQLTDAVTVTGTGFPDASIRTVSFAVVSVAPGLFKSIQYTTVSITAGNTTANGTLTTAVDPAKTLLMPAGDFVNTGDDRSCGYLEAMTNGTTIPATRAGTAGADVIGVTALEFF